LIKYYLTPKAIKAGCKFEQPRQGDSGYDIYAERKIRLSPGEAQWVNTGLYVEIPSTGLYSRVGLIRDRSSMAAKDVYTFAGVIDSNYRGEVQIRMMYLPGGIDWVAAIDDEYIIKPGDKIAQMIIVQHLHWPTRKVESLQDLSQTKRGEDGFGSTGS
jgi:dUTP pyrophosphatase